MLGIILLGPPGAGKGTQATFICNTFMVPQISTGDMLRNAMLRSDTIGESIKQIIAQGSLVPDEIVTELVIQWIKHNKCLNGYLFDGFPRTIGQANSLISTKILITHVLELDVPSDVIIQRLSARRIHVPSGRVYNLLNKPPLIHNKDDITGETLIQREDDKAETIKKRLEIYYQQTMPLTKYYQQQAGIKYVKIDGMQSIDVVNQQILQIVQV